MKTRETKPTILTCPRCAADATETDETCPGCDGDGGRRISGGYSDPDEWDDCRRCEGSGRIAQCPACRYEGNAPEFEDEAIRREIEATCPRNAESPVLSIARIGEE